jgi:DNA-binding XRE family transcriptional regulator
MGKKNFIGKRVKAFRLEKEMTQAEVAVILNISKSTLERIESGGSCSDLTRARIEKRMQNLSEREAAAA